MDLWSYFSIFMGGFLKLVRILGFGFKFVFFSIFGLLVLLFVCLFVKGFVFLDVFVGRSKGNGIGCCLNDFLVDIGYWYGYSKILRGC